MKQGKKQIFEKLRAVMLGHAVGDALGVPVEFFYREELDQKPVSEMLGFGTYPFPAGTWSDDTSMAIAALDSISSGRVDFDDVMQKFCRWYYYNEYTPTGETFDIGNICSRALGNYYEFQKPPVECGPSDERSNGNGSLMRIHPFSLLAFCVPGMKDSWEDLVAKASALTHGHPRSVLACQIYTFVLFALLDSPKKKTLRTALQAAAERYGECAEAEHYCRIFSPDFDKIPREKIKSTGYVVDTLEAALWCLLTTENYRDCVLAAVNLGDDTDTVAAIAGGLAGALYGYDGIPKEWLEILKRREYLEEMCATAAAGWETARG